MALSSVKLTSGPSREVEGEEGRGWEGGREGAAIGCMVGREEGGGRGDRQE